MEKSRKIEDLLKLKEKELLEIWVKAQIASETLREDLMSMEDLRNESILFLREFIKASSKGNLTDIGTADYKPVVTLLRKISGNRAQAGFTPSETATFVFSLKDSILGFLQAEYKSSPEILSTETIRISKLLDKLGLVTFEEYARTRDELVKDQQDSILEMSSPIILIWEKIIAVPIIGILDSKRTQLIMENCLQKIIQTGAKVCIIDVTGVAVLDTLVSTHIIKTANAIRLLGAEAVLTGIRPEVAQTVVHLGVDLSSLIPRATMADGLDYAFRKIGLQVNKR